MPTPSTRTPVRIARGSYSNLNGSVSDLQDGEISYAEDQNKLYVKEGSSLVALTYTPASPAFTGTITGVNLTLSGNLTVNGTQTIINTQTLDVEDKQIEIGKVSSPSDTTADGGGIILKASSDKTILWSNATDTWDFNQGVKIAGNLTVDTNTLHVDATNNRVGIGTTSPSSILHLQDSDNTVVHLGNSSYDDGVIQYYNGSFNLKTGSSNGDRNIGLFTAGSERMRIDSSGRLLLGTTSSIPFWGQNNRAQVIGSDWNTAGLTIGKLGNNNNAPNLVFGISRGSSVGTIVQSGDPVGQINWNADDGTDVNSTVASIRARIDGTPGANDTPGKLEFSTTADGAHASTERLSINSAGIFKFTGVITQVATAAGALDLNLNTSNYFTKTISGNSTFTFSNPAASGTVTAFTLELTHSSGTVTWPSSVKWNADTAPTLTAGKTHLFMFVTDDGGSRYRGSALVDYVN